MHARIALALALAAAWPAPAAADADDPILVAAKVSASSTFIDKKDKLPDRYQPWRVLAPVHSVDGETESYETAWCEGKPSEGVGESLTISFARPQVVDRVSIAGGVWKSDKLFAANNQPSKLEVATDDGRKQIVAMPDDKTRMTVELGAPALNSVTFTIAGVKKGRMNDTCLSEVKLWSGAHELVPLVDVPPAALAALPNALAGASAAFQACDKAELGKAVGFPFKYVEAAHADSSESINMTFMEIGALAKACSDGKTPSSGLDQADRLRAADPGTVVYLQGKAMQWEGWHFAWKGERWVLTSVVAE